MRGLGLVPVLAPLAIVATVAVPSATTAAKGPPTVGATVTVARGRLTVHAYEQPAAVSTTGVKPSRGHEFGAIDVEACNDTSQALAFNPLQFSLELADRTRVHPAAVSRAPALAETSVGPTACVRGWITFEVRRRVRPSSVVFQSGSAFNRTLRLVRWRITRAASTTSARLGPARVVGGDQTVAAIREPGRTDRADRGAA